MVEVSERRETAEAAVRLPYCADPYRYLRRPTHVVMVGDVGIGGSPIQAVAFIGFSPNFDIAELTVTCVNALASCADGGVGVPPVPLNPEPLQPIQDSLGGLVKTLGQ